LNGGVQGRLSVQNQAVGESWSVRNVGLEVDVRRKDITSACRAKLRCIQVGCDEKEWEVGIVVCSHVGEDGSDIRAAFEGP